MKHYRTIHCRLYPTTQAKAAELHALSGACRHVWNHFVRKLKDDYEYYGECHYRWYNNNNKLLTILRQGHKPWLQAYSASIVRHSLKPIETAYQQFFKGQGGLPRFHGRYTTQPSFTCPQGTFKLNVKSLHIQRIGQVGLSGLSPYKASRDRFGKWALIGMWARSPVPIQIIFDWGMYYIMAHKAREPYL